MEMGRQTLPLMSQAGFAVLSFFTVAGLVSHRNVVILITIVMVSVGLSKIIPGVITVPITIVTIAIQQYSQQYRDASS